MIRMHYLQHVPFEDLANIEVWAKEKGFSITSTKLYSDESLPMRDEFDWLVIMGGPMNIYEEHIYRWLGQEKRFIEQAISDGKLVLGICLGAQLIADVLGGKVHKNKYKEIGWFDVELTADAKNSRVFNNLGERFIAFHWHGDTFDIPPGCIHAAKSEVCANQAFATEDGKVVGLQFHLETSRESIEKLLKYCKDDIIDGGKYVQSEEEMLSKADEYLKAINEQMVKLLENMMKGLE